jgi:two-component system response regulator FlrC
MDWPGNVRELENMIARGVLLSAKDEVEVEDIFLEGGSTPEISETSETAINSLMTIKEMEKGLIKRALAETEGNRTHAAKILGISVRTLRNKLAEYRGMGLESADCAA